MDKEFFDKWFKGLIALYDGYDLLHFTIILLILNLIWKFSLGVPFSAMNSGRQINVIASVILIVVMTGFLIRIIVKKNKKTATRRL